MPFTFIWTYGSLNNDLKILAQFIPAEKRDSMQNVSKALYYSS